MKDFVKKIVESYPQLKYSLLEAQTFDAEHYGFPEIYYTMMETDDARVAAFTDAFEQYDGLKDAVVCEAGVGTLALTKHYLPYVKKAYLIENNPNVIDFIRAELKRNNWEDKVELMVGDAMKLALPEPVDFIIGELMSIYCANEYQVQIFRHLRQYLKPNGKLMPEKILNRIQLGTTSFDAEHTHYPLMFTRHLPNLITTQEAVNTIDLYREEKDEIKVTVNLKALLSGTLNCAYLSSWVQTAEGVNFTGTDSLMPPTVIKLAQPVTVKAGQAIALSVSFGYGTSLEEARFEILA